MRVELGSGIRRVVQAILAAGVVLAALTASALGQEELETSAPTQAPIQRVVPARKPFRAARLTYLEGKISVAQANSSAKDTAIINMPLVEGSVISSGDDGQAEIEFEDGSLARITPNSGISLVNLSSDSNGNYRTRIAVLGGLAYLELRAGTKYQYSVDAGGDVISPIENATVRVNFDEAPATIAVLDGSAHISGSKSSPEADANAGQTVRIGDGSDGGTYVVQGAVSPESWDQWNEERDTIAAAEAGSQTDARSKYAGDQGYGWSDLDANGNWYNVPGQGEVWQPEIAAADQNSAQDSADGQDSFDPYGYGSWAWTPAGYTWVSAYGWGWLPYRCGQWSYWDGFGWGWQPGISCGVYGFGGYGYGSIGFNIGHPRGDWHRPHRPIAGSDGRHPIVRLHGGPIPVAPVHTFGGQNPDTPTKTIAGHTVTPLQPIGGGYTPRGGTAIGWGLQRDYPINTATHEPVTGVTPSHSAPVASVGVRAPWQPASPGTPHSHMVPVTPGMAYPPQRAYQGGNSTSVPLQINRPAPIERPSAPVQIQRSSPPPVQHSAPVPAPAPRSAPAPSAPASHSAPAASPHSK